ncbi:MAG: HPF/RaiA family ribosome-associated protein [Hyphomicrobiaceae bacterium]
MSIALTPVESAARIRTPPTASNQKTRQEPEMHIEIRTDSHIHGGDLGPHVERVVGSVLGPFKAQITRVEVHLTDENGGKGGANDKRCVMEARLEGRKPQAATHNAETVEQAIKGAADKLKRVLDSTLGRLRDGH